MGGRNRFADVDLDAWLDSRRVDGRSTPGSAPTRAVAKTAALAVAVILTHVKNVGPNVAPDRGRDPERTGAVLEA